MKFLSPSYLFGLIFVSLPIIIHLFFRKRFRKIFFSSLLFLKSAEVSRLRWLRLKEILILIIRCAMISAIFIALARPQYEGKLFSNDRLASVYMVIDNSLSMHYGKNFETALDYAKKIISSYSSKSEFYLQPLCFNENLKELWDYKYTALKSLANIKLSYNRGSLKEHYERYQKIKTDLPKEFIYIGDGQRINFYGLETLKNFYWVRIPMGSNIFIEEVSLKQPYVIVGKDYELKIKIRNCSKKTKQGKIKLTGKNFIATKEISINSGEDILTFFSLPSTVHNGLIELEFDDSLNADNKFYFSKLLPERIKVLIIGKADYIKTALAPSSVVKSPFEIDCALDLKKKDLRQFHIIILNGLTKLSDFELLALKNFLSQPEKGLLIFPGSVMDDNLKSFLAECGDFENWMNLDGYLNIEWIDKNYPPFSVFKDNTGMKTIKFFKIWKIKPRARVIASLNNNLPLIINWKNLIVFSTELSEGNTDIFYNPNFLPLLHSLIYGITNKSVDNEYLVGDSIPKLGRIKSFNGEEIINARPQIPGFYIAENETICVNIDPMESNPTEIDKVSAENLGVKIIDSESLMGTTDLTNYFLFSLLLVFILELILLIL